MPTTAAKLSCQPGIAAGSGIERQGDGDREQQRVGPRSGTPGKGGDEPGGAHHSGPLDRWSAAGERDVDGDQRAGPEHPGAQRNPEHRPGAGRRAAPGGPRSARRPRAGGRARSGGSHRPSPGRCGRPGRARSRAPAPPRARASLRPGRPRHGFGSRRGARQGRPVPPPVGSISPGSQDHRDPLAPERRRGSSRAGAPAVRWPALAAPISRSGTGSGAQSRRRPRRRLDLRPGPLPSLRRGTATT